MFRLLAARPWSPEAATGHEVCHSMAGTFRLCDVRTDLLRPLANTWARWAMTRVRAGVCKWWSLAGIRPQLQPPVQDGV